MPPLKKLKITEKSSKDVKTLSTQPILNFGDDWRTRCHSIRDIHRLASKQNILTDVTFLVGEKSEIFHAHRLFLALASPVFEAMFYGALAEKNDTISIPDVDPEGFSHLIQYVYSEEVVFKDCVVAFKTAFAADKYCLNSLKKECEHYLCFHNLDATNVWIYLQNSIYLNSSDIRRKCFKYLKLNTESALQHGSFLDVNARTIEAFLQFAEEVQVCEKRLLESVVQWAQHNSSAEDPFKNVIMPLLRYIRFSAINAEEFVLFLERKRLNEVLKTEDALAILKHLHLPKMCPLPDWCCPKPRRSVKEENPRTSISVKKLDTYERLSLLSETSDSKSSSSSSSSSSSTSSSSSPSSSTSSSPSMFSDFD